jgi:hypothetical protein
MNKSNWYQHLIIVLGFFLVISVYFWPVYQGKKLEKNDIVQLKGVGKEIRDYHLKGETILWNTRQFSGLPEWKSSPLNFFYWFHRILRALGSYELQFMLLAFIGLYLVLLGFTKDTWLAGIGAFSFTFSTFNLISLEAGHVNKIMAIACVGPILGGMVLFLRGKMLYGSVLFALFLGIQLFYNHLQITFYCLIAAIIIFGFGVFFKWKSGELSLYVKRILFLAVIAGLVSLCNIVSIWTMWDYQKSSNRGGSELTQNSGNQSSSGLSKDYAMAWSNGIGETFTLLVPYFYGGSSTESLTSKSETYQTLVQNGVNRQQASQFVKSIPLYFGDQPFTAGPIYFGATILFLFLLSWQNLNSNWIRWSSLTIILLTIALSWGKNFGLLSNLFFDYFPLYNKFRSVTMILAIPSAIIPILAFTGLYKIIAEQEWNKSKAKPLFIAFGMTGLLALFFGLLGPSVMSFSAPSDSQMGLPSIIIEAIKSDRISKFQGDCFRSFVLVLILAALLWTFLNKKISKQLLLAGIAVLVMIDLIPVNYRYLSHDDFTRPRNLENTVFQPNAADREILKDEGYYRVYNTSRGITQDGITSYHHHSIGGYSAIKLQRYQELIDQHISRGNRSVLNMLNTKYVIGGKDEVQVNRQACGNAWFVNQVKFVKNADEEIDALSDFNPAATALVDQRFSNLIPDKTLSVNGKIVLDNYHPEELTYLSSNTGTGFAVFSEIYYEPGWKAFIDDEAVDFVRANYVLRALEIPPGEHKIVFKFEPPAYKYGGALGMFSFVFLLILLGMIALRRNHSWLS